VARKAAPVAVVARNARGGSPAAGVRRCALRLGLSKKDGGEKILTTCRSSGGRRIDGKGGGGGDQRRQPAPMGGDGGERIRR
jgi:hypothetical protein